MIQSALIHHLALSFKVLIFFKNMAFFLLQIVSAVYILYLEGTLSLEDNKLLFIGFQKREEKKSNSKI